jgi:hypothetical protein
MTAVPMIRLEFCLTALGVQLVVNVYLIVCAGIGGDAGKKVNLDARPNYPQRLQTDWARLLR